MGQRLQDEWLNTLSNEAGKQKWVSRLYKVFLSLLLWKTKLLKGKFGNLKKKIVCKQISFHLQRV